MADLFEDIQLYLPKYLSADAKISLFEELKQFPANIDSRLYTDKLRNEQTLFQGDGLLDIWVSNLPDQRVEKTRVMVLSNSCDIAPENKRLMGPRLTDCPIVSFPKYENMIRKGGQVPDQHFSDIRRQVVSSMFYLPRIPALDGESIALLDRLNNCDLQSLELAELTKNRLFTLSDYGFYIFLFKISIHLTRIREHVERN